MNEHDIKLADRINARAGDRAPLFVEHKKELYPLGKRVRASLPEEVRLCDRAPNREETLAALKRQGYTLD